MAPTDPLVSLCVPTRNRARSLHESLKSICGQTYPNTEILISDNCSQDDTERVCREWAANDARIRYVRHPQNIGLHGNHNFCLDQARGEFLCICHDHDTRDPRMVARYVEFMQAHPRVGSVCADWDLIDDADRQIGIRRHNVPSVTPGLEYIGQTVRSGRTPNAIPGAMIRREALGEARFVDDAPIGFGDFPIWFRMAEAWDIGHINEVLWSWRQNAESHSARTIESIARDYDFNLNWYCDEHLKRWPSHEALVAEWRAGIRRFLFWALGYEVALHFRSTDSGAHTDRSLFEIMDYRLTREQFEHALAQMRSYRSSVGEYAAYMALTTLIALRLTAPLVWLSRHQNAVRAVLRIR